MGVEFKAERTGIRADGQGDPEGPDEQGPTSATVKAFRSKETPEEFERPFAQRIKVIRIIKKYCFLPTVLLINCTVINTTLRSLGGSAIFLLKLVAHRKPRVAAASRRTGNHKLGLE